MIDLIRTEGKEKDYELVEYVNDVNREHTEVLMELNINGIMDTAYSYGNERLTVERFDGWTGYYTYDPRGSVSGVTGMEGQIWQSYRYDAYGNITFVTMPPTAAQMMMKAIAPVPGSGNLLYPNSGNTSTLQSTL